MKTDTPRTDAKSVDHIGFYSCATVTSDFARQLERELAISLQNQCKAQAEVARLRSTMRAFINFMDENLGTTADWPMEAAFDDEETCQKHCDLLNAMKRLVKPEDIN
jgi:hypothetical protein